MLERQLFLIGLPDSGIDNVGFRAAQGLRIPFTDLDRWISGRAGMTTAEITEKYGAEGLRKIRASAIAFLIGEPCGLILPGEAAMDPLCRKIMRSSGSVLMLESPPEGPGTEEEARERAERTEAFRALADVRIPRQGSEEAALILLERVLRERYHA